MLARPLSQVNPNPAMKEEFLLHLQVQWSNLHQMKIQNLKKSKRKIVCECIGVNGGPTHYWSILLQLSFFWHTPWMFIAPWRNSDWPTTGFSDVLGFFVGQDVILIIHVVCWLYLLLLAIPQWNEIKYIFQTFFDEFICGYTGTCKAITLLVMHPFICNFMMVICLLWSRC